MNRIKLWASKSEENRLAFTGFCIVATMLLWAMPYFIISIIKYGWCGRMPESHAFIFIGAIFLSIWIGFKFSMKFLYE